MRAFSPSPLLGPEEEAAVGRALKALDRLGERLERAEEDPGSLPEALRELAAEGLMGVTAPRGLGGLGLGARALAAVVQAVSEASASAAFSLVAHHLALSALTLQGPAGLLEGYVRRMAHGEVGAFALTEPEGGSDVSLIKTTAEPRGDRYVLRGTKAFVTNAHLATVFVVFANVPGEGLTAFVVDRGVEGLKVGRRVATGCLRGCSSAEIVLEGVEVPRENVVGGIGRGLSVAGRALSMARLGVAAVALGLSRIALNEALAFALNRAVMGQRLSDNPAVRFTLAEAYAKTMASEALLYQAAALLDGGRDASAMVASAKLVAVETAAEVTERAIRLMGGYGVLEEGRAWRAFRDVRCLRVAGGAPEVLMSTVFKKLQREGYPRRG